MQWQATSAAAARTRRSRRPSERGETDPHRERGRRTLRGGVARRRRGRARAVARRAARDRRPAGKRVDGLERARGEAIFTADLRLGGMLHTAVLRSPYASATVKRIDSRRRSRLPGVHARSARATSRSSSADCGYQGVAVAAVCADTFAHAQAASRRSRSSGTCASRCSIPTRRCAGSLLGEPRAARARRLRARARRGRRRRRGRVPTAVVLHNSMETHQAVVQWVADGVEVHISTQYIWGIRDEVAEGLGLAARQGARDLPLHGRRLRLEERRRTTTPSSPPSSRSGPAGRSSAR